MKEACGSLEAESQNGNDSQFGNHRNGCLAKKFALAGTLIHGYGPVKTPSPGLGAFDGKRSKSLQTLAVS